MYLARTINEELIGNLIKIKNLHDIPNKFLESGSHFAIASEKDIDQFDLSSIKYGRVQIKKQCKKDGFNVYLIEVKQKRVLPWELHHKVRKTT